DVVDPKACVEVRDGDQVRPHLARGQPRLHVVRTESAARLTEVGIRSFGRRGGPRKQADDFRASRLLDIHHIARMKRFPAVGLERFKNPDQEILKAWMRNVRHDGIASVERNSAERFQFMRYTANDPGLSNVAEIEDIQSEGAHAAITYRASFLDSFRHR